MWYEVLLPGPVLMIPILIMTTKGTHSPKNDSNQPSDVIVTYSNHAEAPNDIPKDLIKHVPNTNTDTNIDISTNTNKKDTKNEAKNRYEDDNAYSETSTLNTFQYDTGYKSATLEPNTEILDKDYEALKNEPMKNVPPKNRNKNLKKKKDEDILGDPEPEDVVFIPNKREPELIRNEFYLQKDRASLQDLMGGHKTVEDILAAKEVRLETDAPGQDIIFVTGKNNELQETTTKKTKKLSESRYPSSVFTKLDCSNLNCNSSIDSICGEKIENYTPKLRLFLNDCYFRKVNCDFKSASNRYTKVPLLRCKHIGAHYPIPPFPSAPLLNSLPSYPVPPSAPVPAEPKQESGSENLDNRRSFSSRRSMTMNIHGQFCSHPCPSSCPELYEPECAVSSTGRHRVFVNHCALDHNSCSFGIVWHSVPLAQCVGGKKADLRQNAGFIGWMQRIGVVDNRGRLVYDADRR